MKIRACWLVVSVLTLSLVVPAPGAAQEGGWTFRGMGEFGLFIPTRDLGKNVTDAQEITVLQAKSKINSSPMFGAGIEATMPDERLMFRGSVRQTIDGTGTGTVVVCGGFDQTGGICIPQEADTKVTMFTGEVVFLQGEPESALRHQFVLGVGLRSYQVSAQACLRDPSNPDLFVVCELVQQIYEAQKSVQPFLDFGFGFTYSAGPLSATARIIDTVGPYSGGSGNATGNYQNDLMLTGGVSLRIR